MRVRERVGLFGLFFGLKDAKNVQSYIGVHVMHTFFLSKGVCCTSVSVLKTFKGEE